MFSRKDSHCQGQQWTDVKKNLLLDRCLHKDPFKLSNFCKSQHTASVLPNGDDDQPAVDEESLSVQSNHPAVVHLQPVHPADDEPLDDEPIQSAVIHVQSNYCLVNNS